MNLFKCRLSVLFLLSFSFTQAQKKLNPDLLLGSWALDKQVFLEPNDDSVLLRKEGKGTVVTFKKGNKFLTQKRNGKTLKLVGTGTYSIDVEGKHLYQNGAECEIIELTDKVLIFKIDEAAIELHFGKLTSIK